MIMPRKDELRRLSYHKQSSWTLVEELQSVVENDPRQILALANEWLVRAQGPGLPQCYVIYVPAPADRKDPQPAPESRQ